MASMSTTPSGGECDEHARRMRVARIWSGLSRDELAERLGVSFHTVERSETGRRAVDLDELERIGEACGVPASFMRHGWAACADDEHVERVERLLKRFDELFRDVRALR
jgi:transcriptional regulator with XRE-family HTH domain